MPRYLRAFPLADFEAYPRWAPIVAPETFARDAIVYVDESFRVLRSPFDDASVVFEDSSEAWRGFCASLGFETPHWEEESARVRRAVAGAQAGDDRP
jgi:hypothetical protein